MSSGDRVRISTADGIDVSMSHGECRLACTLHIVLPYDLIDLMLQYQSDCCISMRWYQESGAARGRSAVTSGAAGTSG